MKLKPHFKFTMSPEFFYDTTTIFTAKLIDSGEYLVTWTVNKETAYEPKDLQRYIENGIIREAGDS